MGLQEFAPDQLTITHYTELQEEKEIVLMSGMVDGKDNVSMIDAQMLCYLVQHYCVNHPNLMREFNRDPKNFCHDKIIDALDVSVVYLEDFQGVFATLFSTFASTD